MSLIDAVAGAGIIPPDDFPRDTKKTYAETLSRHLAWHVAAGLRVLGFAGVKPLPGGPGEKEFQGGLGPKKVDVSYSDEQHGLMLAVSIKSICFPPYGKNLKNRFGDLCTEAITLHMRFPYAVVAALFAFPAAADEDFGDAQRRSISTFRRATKLFATLSGRREYTSPGEKFENITMLLFRPEPCPSVQLVDAGTGEPVEENDYFETLRSIYNLRNPHAIIDAGGENWDLPF